jgi:hypothetical protein
VTGTDGIEEMVGRLVDSMTPEYLADSQKCEHNYDTPIRKGRAKWLCRKCGQDITLELVMIHEATETENMK